MKFWYREKKETCLIRVCCVKCLCFRHETRIASVPIELINLRLGFLNHREMVKNVVLEFWYEENKEMFYDSGIWNSTLN